MSWAFLEYDSVHGVFYRYFQTSPTIPVERYRITVVVSWQQWERMVSSFPTPKLEPLCFIRGPNTDVQNWEKQGCLPFTVCYKAR